MLFISDKLDAINTILAAVGDSPINTLTDHQNVDAYNAERMLDGMSRQIQSKGWQFNTLENTVVKPDNSSKKIRYNPTWIAVSSVDDMVYVKRGDYLYNMTDKTYTFEKDITLTIIEAVDFEDLPDCFKSYITAKAAIQFQSRYLGDEEISQFLVSEANEAYAELVQYSIDTGVGMFQNPAMAPLLSRKGWH